MDLVYMTDVMAYHAVRGPSYDKYNSWGQPDQIGSPPKNQTLQKKSKGEKEPCKICQENQRRTLMKYIRSKSHDHSGNHIKEEENEDEEEKEEAGQNMQQKS